MYAEALTQQPKKKSSGTAAKPDVEITYLQKRLKNMGYDVQVNGYDSAALQAAYNDAVNRGLFDVNYGAKPTIYGGGTSNSLK